MDDALGVGGFERVGDLNAEIEYFLERHGPATDYALQRLAIEILHDDEGAAVFFADVVNGADIGMIEGRGGLGFAAEALEGLAILGHFFGQEFQGYRTVKARVLSFIDDT